MSLLENVIVNTKPDSGFQEAFESNLSLLENANANTKPDSGSQNADNSKFMEIVWKERMRIFGERIEPKGCHYRIFNETTTII